MPEMVIFWWISRHIQYISVVILLAQTVIISCPPDWSQVTSDYKTTKCFEPVLIWYVIYVVRFLVNLEQHMWVSQWVSTCDWVSESAHENGTAQYLLIGSDSCYQDVQWHSSLMTMSYFSRSWVTRLYISNHSSYLFQNRHTVSR